MARPILYLVGAYPSLTEIFVENEVQGLRRLGLSVEVRGLAPLHPFRSLAAIARSPLRARKLWQCLALPRRGSVSARAKLWFRALQVLDAADASEHIHAHFLGYPATVARALAKVAGVKYSLTAHAHDIYVAQTHPSVVRDASFRSTCTEANRQYLRERYPEWPFELVRHGITATEASPRSSSPTPSSVLAVGRCVEKKGFAVLLDACAKLRREGRRLECTVAGDGPELQRLREQAERLGIAPHVRFTGSIPHERVLTLYARADVLAVPSVIASNGDRDGIPNVLLEAMAQGVPVIATNVGGISEVVQDGLTGLLVAPGDATQLADAIVRVFTEPSLRERLVEGARLTLEKEFSPDPWLLKLRDLFCRHAKVL